MKLRKFLALLLSVALAASLLTLPVHAETVASGTCGENLTWMLDEEGTMTISGTGEMQNCYDFSYQPWNSYRTHIQKAVLEAGVTSIGGGAFSSCSGLTSVTIPDSVTSIGTVAFYDCSGLTDVYYSGTEEQWREIEIAAYNDPLLNATIHYNVRNYTSGDLNGDDKVNNRDAQLLFRYVSGYNVTLA